MLAWVHNHLQLGLSDVVDNLAIQRIRRAALGFYPTGELLDLQLQRPDDDAPLLCSAIVSPRGFALLDGRSALLYEINRLLPLRLDDNTASAYLRFFCAFIRADEGPFQIIDELEDLPLVDSNVACVADRFLSPITPLRVLDGNLESDGWRRFEGCALYGNGVFRAIFKVYATGMVEMEGDLTIAGDLPIRRLRYNSIFRTPLLAPSKD
jgi:hypothetical protein